MTKRELAVIMAYTDVITLTGNDLKYFYEYISKVAGKKVYTHEIPKIVDMYRDTTIASDFIALCKLAKYDEAVKPIVMPKPLGNEHIWWQCPNCTAHHHTNVRHNYCHLCGQKMDWSDYLQSRRKENNGKET